MFKRTAFFFVCITQILSSHAQGEKVCCGKAGNPVQSCGFLQPNAGTVVAGGSAALCWAEAACPDHYISFDDTRYTLKNVPNDFWDNQDCRCPTL